jgi:hypothetical protein
MEQFTGARLLRSTSRGSRRCALLLLQSPLADPDHPDHDDAKEWFGDFDPNRFDDQPIKDRLARIANRRRSASVKRKQR